MTTWCASFLLSALLASAGASFLVIAIVALGIGLLFAKGTKAYLVTTTFVITGAWWGFFGHGPAGPPGTTRATVVKAERVDVERIALIVAWDGGRASAEGVAAEGQTGILQCAEERGVLVSARCRFTPDTHLQLGGNSLVEAAGQWVGAAGVRQFFWRGWLDALLLGRAAHLSLHVKQIFKDTGLYHLLIVSGLHVNLIGAAVPWLVRGPIQLAYALRLVSPIAWVRLRPAFTLLGLIMTFFYLLATGCSAPGQRSFLVHALAALTPLILGHPPSLTRLRWALALQMLLYPVAFLTMSTLLSWSAYIFVIPLPEARNLGLRARISSLAVVQAWLCVLMFGLIGTLTPLGIILNLVVTPLFPLLFALALVSLAASAWAPTLAPPLFRAQQGCLDFVAYVAEVSRQYGGVITLEIDASALRAVAIALVGAAILERLACLRTRPHELPLEWQTDPNR